MAILSDVPELIGFFSYSREDDTDSYGRLSALRGRIQAELRGLLGRTAKTFRLWQDKEAIPSGTLWESEINGAVSQAVFFIPIITPTVVASRYCRFELQAFIEREVSLGRDDLIFPILYIDVPALEDGIALENDAMLSLIAKRQYVDWREFRFLDVDSTEVRREVGRFCTDIRNALRRRWVSPEELKKEEAARQEEQAERARQEKAARQKEQAERARQEKAARQKEQAERARQEEAARQNEQAERTRQEEAARQNEQAERARQEEAARQTEQAERARQETEERRARDEARQRTTEQHENQVKAEPSPVPVPEGGEQPRSAEPAQQGIFTAVKGLVPKGVAATDRKKLRLAAIVGAVVGIIVLAIAVWPKPPNPPASNNVAPAQPPAGNVPGASSSTAQMFPFEVCNHTAAPADVAVAAHVSATDKRWEVEGWWAVSPGQCTTIGSYPQGWFYYYAKSDGRDWPGTTADKSNTCIRSANFRREDPEGYKCSGDETMVAFNGKQIDSSATFTWTLESGSSNAPVVDNGPASNNAPAANNAPADGLTQREIDACINRNDRFSLEEQINGCTEAIRSGRWKGKDLAWAYGNRCIAYKDKAQYDRAMRDCDEAITLDEKNAYAYNTRGAIYYLTDKYDQAIEEYSKAIKYDPKFVDPLHNRAMTYVAKGDYDTAIDDYNAALRIDSHDAVAMYKRGVAKQRLGDKNGGNADIVAAKKIDPHVGD